MTEEHRNEKDEREDERLRGMAMPGKDWTATLPGDVKLEMVWVEPGKFLIGCTFHDYTKDDLKDLCEVTLTKGYWIGKYPFIQEQWKAIGAKKRESNNWNRARLPVENVNWNEAIKCCKKLGDVLHDKFPSSYRFALPTEAQWEFAARGGMKTQDYEFSGGNVIGDVAWYNRNSGGCTHEVGLKKPNELGVYDMSGNVCEWCFDYWKDRYPYPSGTVIDPVGESSGSYRVVRGGSWFDDDDCRSSYRDHESSSCRGEIVGFRVALVPVE